LQAVRVPRRCLTGNFLLNKKGKRVKQCRPLNTDRMPESIL
jgi:hypothetical protein